MRRLARHPVSGRNVDRDGDGKLSGGTGQSPCARVVSAAYHFKRRQLWITSIHFDDWCQVMRRELQAGLFLGAILGAIGVVRVGAWAIVGEQYLHQQPYGAHWPLVALTVGIALVIMRGVML